MSQKKPIMDTQDSSLEEETKGCTTMGHLWHWSEFYFMIMTVVGFISVYFDQPMISAVLFVATAAVAVMLIWNLVSIKRIAAATDLIEKDVAVFQEENNRARGMQATKRRQDEEMKDRVSKLAQAELLLSASARNLEGIASTEAQMHTEREDMLKKRQELNKEMEKDLIELQDITLETAKIELEQRALMFFTAVDRDGDGMVVDSSEWKSLVSLMDSNGIEVDASVAGADKTLDEREFEDFLTDMLDSHFESLGEAVKVNEKLEETIRDLELRLLPV